jgi:hypothetical protein
MSGMRPSPAQTIPTSLRIRITAIPADISIRRRAKRETYVSS